MIHCMFQGGPADGHLKTLNRHQAPKEIRVGVWNEDAWVSSGEAHTYVLLGEDALENTAGLHKAASYQYTGTRDSSPTLITVWV